MKNLKLLILLLLSLASISITAQTPTRKESNFSNGIKNSGAQTVSNPTYLATSSTEGVYGKITPVNLIIPITPINYTPTNTTIGEQIKGIDGKLGELNSKIPVNYSKIVYVNATNPNSATIFDLENPPTVNDNSLKADVNNLYVGTDASTWIYNTPTVNYITKSVTTTTTITPKITITTSTSITTATTDLIGLGQDGRHVVISNGVNPINITCNGGVTTSYGKVGTGAITFIQGSGRILVQLSGTNIFNGIPGSTATLWSNGTTDYLSINNY